MKTVSRVTQSWVIKKIASSKDKFYIKHLRSKVIHIQKSNEQCPVPKLVNIPKYIASVERPDKEDAIKKHAYSFSV